MNEDPTDLNRTDAAGEDHARMRARLAALDDQRVAELAAAHAAAAAAQDRSYWLDRWGLDLNAAMRSPGGARLGTALKSLRSAQRVLTRLRRDVRREAQELAVVEPFGAFDTIGPRDVVRPPAEGDVTERLWARLDPRTATAVEEALEAERRELWDGTDETERRRLGLSLGLERAIPGVAEATGLAPPPADDASGAELLAAADLVAGALAAAGAHPSTAGAVLELGEGAAVGALSIAFPDAEWHAASSEPRQITWASEHLPAVTFAELTPGSRLPYEDEKFEAVYALEQWEAGSETDRLAEMERVTAPGAALLLTAHGAAATRALLTRVIPPWTLAYFAPGGAPAGADVLVLVKK